MGVELWIGVAGLVIGIAAIPVSFVLARRSRRRPTIRTMTDFDILMSPDHGIARDALSIAYADRSIERVSRTNVAIWNDRGDTIHGVDIVSHDPFRVQVADGDVVLQVRVLSVSREQCKIAADLDGADSARVLLTFDFLDDGDGAVLELLHIGADAPVVAGTIRGSKLESRGSGRLTPPDLDIASKRWALVKLWSTFASVSVFRSALRLFIIPLTNMAVAVIALIWVLQSVLRRPQLVDPTRYDLSSIDGQANYAQEITALGVGPSPSTMIPIFGGLILLFSISYLLLRRSWSVKIPHSIVGVRYYDIGKPEKLTF